MNFLSTMTIPAVAAATASAFAGPVVNLAPGQMTDSLSGINNTEMPELIGVSLMDKYIGFSIASDAADGGTSETLYQATLMTRVVRSYETGNLTFNYEIIEPNAALTGRISHITVGGFGDFQTRVEYRDDAVSIGEEGPSMAERSADGDTIDFTFDGGLNTGDDSHFFFAMTNTDVFYEDSALATIWLETGESVSLVVDSATPPNLPTPGALALLGGAGLLGARRRR